MASFYVSPGLAGTIDIGTVSGVPHGDPPTVTNVGTANNAVLDIALPIGADGDSAYEVAVANGFVGDEAAWLASLGNAVTSVNGSDGIVVLDAADVGAATAAQGALADTAVQPGDLAAVATSGAYSSLSGLPTLGTAAAQATSAFATAAQGALADTAVQPGDLATVATSGAYSDLSGRPTLGTAAAQATSAFATAAQGALAATAVQPGDLATVATSGAYSDLSGRPTLGTAAAAATGDFATAAQGALADTALQPSTPQIVPLTVASNAATISDTSTGKVYSLTINSTSAFTLTVTIPSATAAWDAEVIITTTQIPVSFTFAGAATKRDVPGSTLSDNPPEAGKVTVMLLSKLSAGNYTAQFSPAITV